MSGGEAGGRGNGASVAAPIPTGSRKLVQNLKEIVNCPDSEIYAMLRECNMDPNEAVHRLLSQDTFHEVKNKRDKKKEIREPLESRSRTMNNNSGRVARSGNDHGSHSTSLSSLTDYGISKSKSTVKKENGTDGVAPITSVLDSAMISSNLTRGSTVQSSSASMGNIMMETGFDDGISTSMHSSSGFPNSSWLGKPGRVSMADIVKMGRTQTKHADLHVVTNESSNVSLNLGTLNLSHYDAKQSTSTILPSESDKIVESFQESTHPSEIIHVVEGQHVSDDGLSLVDEQPTEYISTTTEISAVSDACTTLPELALSNLITDYSNLHIDPDSEDQDPEGSTNVNNASNLIESTLEGADSYQPQRHDLDHHEGSLTSEDTSVKFSSASVNLRQLSLHEETTKPINASPAVIIPNHLLVTNADCAHLSFGSFGSGAFSGSFPSKQLECNLDVTPAIDDAPRIEEPDERNHDLYSNGQLKPILSENVASISGTVSENHDAPSVSHPEVTRNDPLDATHDLQYNFPSVSSYSLPSSSQTNATSYTYIQGNSQLQSLSPISSLMQPNTTQNSILAANIPQLREFDLPLGPFITNQSSMPTRYSTAVASINGAITAIPEALNPGMSSNGQSLTQSLPSTTMLTNPSPQPLPVHHYSQAALPLGHFPNMISYPVLPQSYTYLPSIQQSLSANSPFHQSAALSSAGMKYSQPQYKSTLPVVSLPQASAISSVYRGFGSSSTVPTGFNLNHTAPSASATIGFDEALSLQFKEASHYLPLQQSENSAMWIHGAGSRTMSSLPASTFYNYQGQNQHSGFRQVQQPSQTGVLGYSNLYHSQVAPSREQQQNLSEGNLNGSQIMQTQQANQIWPHGY